MIRVPSLLLVMVAVTHYGYQPLADFYADTDKAARAIFYVLRGIEGCALYALVWWLAPKSGAGFRVGLAIACAWGMLESAQTSVCRIAAGIGQSVAPPAYHGLCDVVTGLPIYGMTALVALVVACFAQETNHG